MEADIQALRKCIHDMSGAYGLLSGYVEIAVMRPNTFPLSKLAVELEKIRERWDAAQSAVQAVYARRKAAALEPAENWKERAESAERVLMLVEEQRDRWLNASTACAVGAGQTLADILKGRQT